MSVTGNDNSVARTVKQEPAIFERPRRARESNPSGWIATRMCDRHRPVPTGNTLQTLSAEAIVGVSAGLVAKSREINWGLVPIWEGWGGRGALHVHRLAFAGSFSPTRLLTSNFILPVRRVHDHVVPVQH